MDIATCCQRRIITVKAEASLRQAALLMREQHVGALVVTDSADTPRVLGLVTDRDLAIEVLARDLDAGRVRIGEIASRSVVAVAGTVSVQEAVDAMERGGVRRLLVTGDDDRVIGFLSADDLVEAIADELSGLAGALRSGIARETAERLAIASPQPRPVFLPLSMPNMH